MSFAHEVKKEIAQLQPSKAAYLRAQGYGLFLFSKVFSPGRVLVQTENEFTAQVAADYLARQHIAPAVSRASAVERGAELFRLEVADAAACARLLAGFGCRDALPVNRAGLDNAKTLSFFLGGVFLACGNVTDPEKSYHLEFNVASEALGDELEDIIGEIAPCKRAERKGAHVVYIKESEQIEDLLTFLGATKSSLAMMETKIVKGIRNRANRQTNCETANIGKVTAAAVQQCEDIRLLVDRLGWDGLPDELQALAQLRLECPEDSLRELGEALDPPLTRSGVNHRFDRIARLAERERGAAQPKP